jgi:electron transfer flavoprotein alpha subunit
VTNSLKANVFLNSLSRTLAPEAKAIGAFLAAHPWIAVSRTVTLVRDLSETESLAQLLPPSQSRSWLQANRYQPEQALEKFQEAQASQAGHADLALFPPGFFGAEMAGRLAARLNGSAVLGLADLLERDGTLVAQRPAYSQNLTAELRLDKKPYCLSLSKQWSARPWQAGHGNLAEGQARDAPGASQKLAGRDTLESLPEAGAAHLLSYKERPLEDGKDLSGAKTLVVAGFGMGDKEGVRLAAELALAMGAQWGVSRPVAMNAWAPLERLIGVSGAMTAPKWAICLGASGAAALLSGLDKAERVAAINIDPQAPIMTRCDLAIVGPAKEIASELLKLALKEGHVP